MIFLQHFSDLGIGIVKITKDNRLAFSAGLDTGGLFSRPYPFIPKVSFFNDPTHSPRINFVSVFPKRFRVTPI